MRGLGGTGSSRSLVLADGVPLNDAFGGWVYWDKLPQVAIDRIEVQRGSGSDLYGADAVGGVIQILSLHPSRATGRALFEAGQLGTGRVSLFGGGRRQGWGYSLGGEETAQSNCENNAANYCISNGLGTGATITTWHPSWVDKQGYTHICCTFACK